MRAEAEIGDASGSAAPSSPLQVIMHAIFQAAPRVFTLLIEARDKLRVGAKCTTVCGRRINIFLYSPRTHFSSVKHVLIINLFNTHTASAGYGGSHPPRSNRLVQLPLFEPNGAGPQYEEMF